MSIGGVGCGVYGEGVLVLEDFNDIGWGLSMASVWVVCADATSAILVDMA